MCVVDVGKGIGFGYVGWVVLGWGGGLEIVGVKFGGSGRGLGEVEREFWELRGEWGKVKGVDGCKESVDRVFYVLGVGFGYVV